MLLLSWQKIKQNTKKQKQKRKPTHTHSDNLFKARGRAGTNKEEVEPTGKQHMDLLDMWSELDGLWQAQGFKSSKEIMLGRKVHVVALL